MAGLNVGKMRARRSVAVLVAASALASISVAPAGASNEDFVAMGDSYASGTGTDDYYDEDCERSHSAYPELAYDAGSLGASYDMVACSGATTSGTLSQANNVGANTDYVTISIGGNDAGFSSVLVECALPSWLSDCDSAIDDAQDTIEDTLPGRLEDVYDKIEQRSPDAIVTVVGYPRIFNGDDCNAATYFDEGEMTRLNQTADLLADVTRGKAREHGFSFADARFPFIGHAVCDSPEWINGLSYPTGESYHPNKSGHQGYKGFVRSSLLAAPAPSFVRGPNGRIAFSTSREGNDEIFAANGNGQFPVNLTNNSGSDQDPVWSPDGTRIAFASKRDGGADYEIYVMSANGTGVTQLTNNTAEDRDPSWSPNAAYLAFRSDRDGDNEIFRMTATGGSQTQLTANSASDAAPDWSPDGAEIAYQRDSDVWKMESDGQGQTELTSDAADEGQPAWSPNGSQIAYHSKKDGDYEIFTMTATGGSQTQRTSNSASDIEPSWSPNGSQIAFRSDRDGNAEIYTMTSTGGSQTRRTTDSGSDVAPSWQGDKTPPQTAITQAPTGDINTATPSFQFSSDEPGSSFECKVDNGSFASCSTPHTTAPLSDGSHQLQVRAIDPSGNVDTTPAESASFNVDTTPAATGITAGPTGLTNDVSPSFEFSSEEPGVTFTCELDGAAPAPCTSPHDAGVLADGDHTFRVIGTDAAGNTSEDSVTFTVDTLSPETILDAAPPTPTNESSPSFSFSSEPDTTFECRLDFPAGDDWAECNSPYVPATPLDDAAHTFEVRAIDGAGNVDGSAALITFVVDTVAPDATIDAGPPAKDPLATPPPATSDTTPSFDFSSNDPTATLECRVDTVEDADWAACASPMVTQELEDGDHTFEVQAVDGAGNVGVGDERTFVVDATDPTTHLDPSGPSGTITDRTPSFDFNSDDPTATFECRVDSAIDWTACEPDQPTDEFDDGGPLPDGPHTFDVRAVDTVGNADASPETRAFSVDATAPTATITESPGSLTNDSTPRFGFALAVAESLAHFECKLDSGDFTGCNAPLTTPVLADGAHTFQVRAVDQYGNTQAPAVERAFTVDSAVSAATIDSGPSGTISESSATFAFSSGEAGASFECRLDSAGEFEPCSSPLGTGELEEGAHRFEVRARDGAGNVQATPTARTFTVDLPEETRPGSPSNEFTLGKAKLKKKKGTALLSVTLPGAGTVELSGDSVRSVRGQALGAGEMRLQVKARGKAKRALTKRGKATVEVEVTFTPTGGQAHTVGSRVRLVRR